MAIITIRTEKNLDELLNKMYAGLKPSELKRLQTATLKANPHLGIEDNFKAGTVVVLPSITRKSAKVSRTNDARPADGIENMIAALKNYAPVLTQELVAANAALDQTSKLTKSAGFKRALEGADTETMAIAENLLSSLKTETEENGDLSTKFTKNLSALQKNLEVLLKNLS